MRVVYQDGDTIDSLLDKLHYEERSELDAHYAAGRPFPRRVPLCIEVRYGQFRTFFELLNGRIEQHLLISERTFLGVPVVVLPPDHRYQTSGVAP